MKPPSQPPINPVPSLDFGQKVEHSKADAGFPLLSQGGVDAELDTGLLPHVHGYQVHDLLGRGGMGTVWRATDLSTGREVALKLLGSQTLGSRRARLRFEREVSLASRLEHPGIARVYASGLAEGTYFYAMELIRGLPLDQYIRQNTLDDPAVIELFIAVSDAIGYAHVKGVIHRDLKPSNVLIDEHGRPHVLDFGLAVSDQPDDLMVSVDGSPVGTLAYMPPEQAAGQLDRIDARSDIYSLGVMLFEAVSGQLPYEPWTSRLELENRVARHEIRRLRSVRPSAKRDLEAIVARCLAGQPEGRYPSVAELAGDLRALLHGEPVTAVPLTVTYVVRRRMRRYWREVSAAAFVLLLLVGVAVVSYVQVQQQRDIARANEREAIAARDRAEHLLYVNQLANARALLQSGHRSAAVAALDACEPGHRDAAWSILRHLADASAMQLKADRLLLGLGIDELGVISGIDTQGTIWRWSLDAADPMPTHAMGVGQLTAVAADAAGRWLVVDQYERNIYRVIDGQPSRIGTLPLEVIGQQNYALSPEDDVVLIGGHRGGPGSFEVYSLREGRVIARYDGPMFTRRPFVAGRWRGFTEPENNTLVLLDENWQAVQAISLPGVPSGAVAEAGDALLLGLDEGRVARVVLDEAGLAHVTSLVVDENRRGVTAVAAHHGWVFAGLRDGEVVAVPLDRPWGRQWIGGVESAVSMLLVHDGRWLLAGSGATVKVYDLAGSSWAMAAMLASASEQKSAVMVLGGGRRVLLADQGGTVRALNTADMTLAWERPMDDLFMPSMSVDDLGRVYLSGPAGWAVLDGVDGRVLAAGASTQQTHVVAYDADHALLARHDEPARLVDLRHGEMLDDARPVRPPLGLCRRVSHGPQSIVGVCEDDPNQLVMIEPGSGQPPLRIKRFDHPIQVIEAVGVGWVRVRDGTGEVFLVDLTAGQSTPVSGNRGRAVWSADGSLGLTLGEQTVLIDRSGQALLALDLPRAIDAAWMDDRQAWLVLTDHNLELLPADPARSKRAR